jgi:hypothetical protein
MGTDLQCLPLCIRLMGAALQLFLRAVVAVFLAVCAYSPGISIPWHNGGPARGGRLMRMMPAPLSMLSMHACHMALPLVSML